MALLGTCGSARQWSCDMSTDLMLHAKSFFNIITKVIHVSSILSIWDVFACCPICASYIPDGLLKRLV